MDFFGCDEELWSGVPVSAGHLVLHLVHSGRSRSDPHTSWLMEAHCLEQYSTLLLCYYCYIRSNETCLEIFCQCYLERKKEGLTDIKSCNKRTILWLPKEQFKTC